PFGSAGRGEFGTYFVGYAASPGVIEQMLANMFIGDPAGNYDRILDFSAAVTGGMFFVPSAEFLHDPPGPPGLHVPAPAPPEPAPHEPAAGGPAARAPARAVPSAPPGTPPPPGPPEPVGGLTRSGPGGTTPPRV